MWGMPWYQSPKLNVEALGLEGRELEIATIVAEETEAERELAFAALPPISAQEARKKTKVGTGLLSGPLSTVGEQRRATVDAIPWDELFRRRAHWRIVERARIDFSQVATFVIQKCNPPNWEAMRWYAAWIEEAVSDKMPREAVDELLAKKQAEGAVLERKEQSAKGGNGKKEAYAGIEAFAVEQWMNNGWRYESKKLFAEALCAEVFDRFGRKVKSGTITDKYLLPSRLSKQIGTAPQHTGK